MPIMARICAWIAGGVCAVAAGMAQAALTDCRPPEKSQYLVFLNEPEYSSPGAFATREQMLRFFDALQEHLDQRRDLEMAGLPVAPFRVARCVGRVPSIDGKDYTRELVRSLYNRSVVIEIWGRLDADTQGGKRVNARAQINYLLTPLRRASDEGRASVPSLHRFNYPDGEITATDFVDLVSNADLLAFVATGIGMMAFDADDFPVAQQFLCTASPRLERIRKRLEAQPATKAQSDTVRQLRAFVLERAGAAVKQLAASGGGGAAALLSPGDPCRERTTP